MTIAKFGKTPITLETLGVTLQRLWNNIPPRMDISGYQCAKEILGRYMAKRK